MDIKKILQMVRSFQKASGQTTNKKPSLNSPEEAGLRHALLLEENNEYLEAAVNNDKVEILDAVVDALYILAGTINEHGLQDLLVPAFELVHNNNMTKVGADGKCVRSPQGKILKPEGYKPVDLSVLFKAYDL